MTIAFFSNFINHHQKLVADELDILTDYNYTFVEMLPMPEWLKKGGYSDFSYLPYVLRAWENEESMRKAKDLAKEVDVALFGGNEVLELEVFRVRNTNKLTFEVSERWLKRGWINLLSPRLLKAKWYYHTLFRKKAVYKLCSSAYGARDEYKLFSFKNRCFKWGYFTKVYNLDVEAIRVLPHQISATPTFMWCSRYLMWKHPELPLWMAARLKAKGYKFVLDMYGSGWIYERALKLAYQLDVKDVVNFCGNMPNEQILAAMRKHDIFLFTSDRNEGWGAVANEAMSSGCVLVASQAIGSVPFLVEDGITGITFKSSHVYKGFGRFGDTVDNDALDSLCEKVEWLLEHPIERKQIALNGYKTIRNIWSPANAAQKLIQLIEDLQNGRDTSIMEGPCSKATPFVKKY